MGISKKLRQQTLRLLLPYADNQMIRVTQKKHLKYTGMFEGEKWTFTLPCSPSGQYVEGSLRSLERKFKRRFASAQDS
jgi:hypothetical protein